MPDLRLKQLTNFPAYQVSIDFALTAEGIALDEREALATAVVLALGLDARARDDEVLPDPDDDDRRGWWADIDASEIWDAWPVGTRLWLLRRAKITNLGAEEGSTLARAEAYATEALQPFQDKRICSRFEVHAIRSDVNRIDMLVTMYRGPLLMVDLRYQILWEELR